MILFVSRLRELGVPPYILPPASHSTCHFLINIHDFTLLLTIISQSIKSHVQSLRPLRPPFRRVLSVGMGVTSSILPIFIPARARALRADCAPGPGVLVLKVAWEGRDEGGEVLVHLMSFLNSATADVP